MKIILTLRKKPKVPFLYHCNILADVLTTKCPLSGYLLGSCSGVSSMWNAPSAVR